MLQNLEIILTPFPKTNKSFKFKGFFCRKKVINLESKRIFDKVGKNIMLSCRRISQNDHKVKFF